MGGPLYTISLSLSLSLALSPCLSIYNSPASTTNKKSSTPPGAAHANLDENKLKPSDLPPKVQAAFKKRLDGLSDEEREVEERAIKAEIQAGEQVAQSLGNIYERQAEEKRLRKEQGKETIGDRVSSIFGFR